MKYKELVYDGKTYTETYDIEEILINNDMVWFVDAETENVRLEILKDVLIVNGGIWYNGIFKYGAIRNLEWKYGTFKNGVWFGGTWYGGVWENGIIFSGKFYSGSFMNGKIRTTDQKGTPTKQEFVNCEVSPNIKKV